MDKAELNHKLERESLANLEKAVEEAMRELRARVDPVIERAKMRIEDCQIHVKCQEEIFQDQIRAQRQRVRRLERELST